MTTSLQRTSLGELGYSPLLATSLGELGTDSEFIPRPERTQDFIEQQRELTNEAVNRALDLEQANKMTKFADSARILAKSNVNRTTSVKGKSGKTSFKSKNRTIN